MERRKASRAPSDKEENDELETAAPLIFPSGKSPFVCVAPSLREVFLCGGVRGQRVSVLWVCVWLIAFFGICSGNKRCFFFSRGVRLKSKNQIHSERNW